MWNTPDLCDDHADKVRVLPPIYNNYGGKKSFYGAIETVKCFEDNSRVKELVATDGRGRVIVVDGGGSLRKALIGDLMAAEAIENGWAGIIIHGCCRDVHDLINMELGVRALNSIPVRSTRKGGGEVSIEIEIGGVNLKPDMWVYADETGIVVSDDNLLAKA